MHSTDRTTSTDRAPRRPAGVSGLLLPGALLLACASAGVGHGAAFAQDATEETTSSSSSSTSSSTSSSSDSDSDRSRAAQSESDRAAASDSSSTERSSARSAQDAARDARTEAMRAIERANRSGLEQGLEELKRLLADKQLRAQRAAGQSVLPANVRREYTFSSDGRTVRVIVDGVDAKATVDDVPLAPERIRRSSDGTITLLDDEGAVIGRVPTGHSLFSAATRFGAAPPSPVVVGFVLDQPDEVLAAHLGVDPRRASLVTEVTAGLPAAAAGLERYDLLVAVNGTPDAGPDRLQAILNEAAPGEPLELVVRRGPEQRVLVVRPESRERVADSEAFLALNESARILRQRIGDVGEVMVAPQVADGELTFQLFVDSPYASLVDPTARGANVVFPEGIDREIRDAVRLEVNAVMPGIAAWIADDPAAPDLASGWNAAVEDAVGARLKSIEDRLTRIEALLERLVGGDT